VALEGEQHSIRNADGAEDAPTVHQASLSGREALLVSIQKLAVVKQ